MTRDKIPNESMGVEEPAGGAQLFRALRGLAEEYALRATAEKDHAAAALALALALHALVYQASGAGLRIRMTVSQQPMGG